MRLTGLAALILVTMNFLTASMVRAEDGDIAALIKQLESNNVGEKTKAVRILGDIGPAAVKAAPALIKLHNDPDPGLRYEVAVALGRINSDGKQVVPALSHLLSDNVAIIKLSAIEGLRGFGSQAQSAVPELTKLLDDKEPQIAVSAARTIAEIKMGKPEDGAKVKSVLIAGLKNDRAEVAADAIHGLAILGSDSVGSIRELLSSPNQHCRIQACSALEAIGPGSASAVEDLVKAAQSSESELRWHALSALGEIGPEAKAAIPVLVAGLEDKDQHVKLSAEQSLRKIGKPAVPALIEGLKKESLQQEILPILAEIGPDAAEAVPALTSLLSTKNTETRREVIIALAGIGEAAKPTSAELIKYLSDKQFPSRPAAAFALGKIKASSAIPVLKDALQNSTDSLLQLASVWALLQFDPQNEEYITLAIPRLTKALENEKPEVRREAIKSLGHLGARAKGSVAELQKGLKDKDPEIRRETLIALAEIGPDSAAAVGDVIAVLNEDSNTLRPIAIYALGRIGAAAKPATAQLHRFLFSYNPHEKTVAAWALVHITPDADTLKSAIPLIIKALARSENPEARSELARTLGKYGASFPDAKDALKAALKDPDPNVRKSAESALAELK